MEILELVSKKPANLLRESNGSGLVMGRSCQMLSCLLADHSTHWLALGYVEEELWAHFRLLYSYLWKSALEFQKVRFSFLKKIFLLSLLQNNSLSKFRDVCHCVGKSTQTLEKAMKSLRIRCCSFIQNIPSTIRAEKFFSEFLKISWKLGDSAFNCIFVVPCARPGSSHLGISWFWLSCACMELPNFLRHIGCLQIVWSRH